LTHQIEALNPIGLFLPEFGSNSLQLFNKGITRMVASDIDRSVIDQVYAGCSFGLVISPGTDGDFYIGCNFVETCFQ
jgi:hypothetical protein